MYGEKVEESMQWQTDQRLVRKEHHVEAQTGSEASQCNDVHQCRPAVHREPQRTGDPVQRSAPELSLESGVTFVYAGWPVADTCGPHGLSEGSFTTHASVTCAVSKIPPGRRCKRLRNRALLAEVFQGGAAFQG